MPCMAFPGGVLAGVPGTERALFIPVSIASGCDVGTEETGMLLHSYEVPLLPMPIMLDALAGGVGKVCALSSPGLPDAGIELEGWWP